jgi:signal transduction histidine kinase
MTSHNSRGHSRHALLDVLVSLVGRHLGISCTFVSVCPSHDGMEPRIVAMHPKHLRIEGLFHGRWWERSEASPHLGPKEERGLTPLASAGDSAGRGSRPDRRAEPVIISSGIQQRFPSDPLLRHLEGESLAALPFHSGDGAVRGCVGMIDSRPLRDPKECELLLATLAEVARWVADHGNLEEVATETPPIEPPVRRRGAEAVARDGFWEWDLQSGAIWFSERCLVVLGAKQTDDLSPELWLDRVHPEDVAGVLTALVRLVSGESDRMVRDHRVVTPDTTRHVQARFMAIMSERGMPTRLTGWLCDVTEERRLATDLRAGRDVASVGRLAIGLAHDLNGFLQIIRSHASIALGTLEVTEAVREDFDLIGSAVDRAATLIRQLLLLVHQGRAAELQTVDVNATISDMERLLRVLMGKRVRLIADLSRDRPTVLVEAGVIERILVNLVSNARDALGESGTIRIATEQVQIDGAQAARAGSATTPGDYVALRVSDSGEGMDVDTLAHAFDAFFTTKSAECGTGLGLHTVRGLVERSGGVVHASSAPGFGTTITVLLPAYRPARD